MLLTRRKPATLGEILVEGFMQPLGLRRWACSANTLTSCARAVGT